jgi:hypothetical protein
LNNLFLSGEKKPAAPKRGGLLSLCLDPEPDFCAANITPFLPRFYNTGNGSRDKQLVTCRQQHPMYRAATHIPKHAGLACRRQNVQSFRAAFAACSGVKPS